MWLLSHHSLVAWGQKWPVLWSTCEFGLSNNFCWLLIVGYNLTIDWKNLVNLTVDLYFDCDCSWVYVWHPLLGLATRDKVYIWGSLNELFVTLLFESCLWFILMSKYHYISVSCSAFSAHLLFWQQVGTLCSVILVVTILITKKKFLKKARYGFMATGNIIRKHYSRFSFIWALWYPPQSVSYKCP